MRKPTRKTRTVRLSCGHDHPETELRSAIGKLNNSLRSNAGGPPRTCECGKCATCIQREYQRNRRANARAEALAALVVGTRSRRR